MKRLEGASCPGLAAAGSGTPWLPVWRDFSLGHRLWSSDDNHLQNLHRIEWREAERAGFYRGSAVDVKDGFIHFSTAEQATETAAKWFTGQRDLVLVAVDADALGDALKWEPSRGGALFPHLYGALDLQAVRQSIP